MTREVVPMLRVACLSLCLLPALAQALLSPSDREHPRPLLDRAQELRSGAGRSLSAGTLQLREHWAMLAADPSAPTQRERVVRSSILAGVVVGGLLGAGAGLMLLCTPRETGGGTNPPFAPTCALLGGVVGAALGAGVGAIVGMARAERNSYQRHSGATELRLSRSGLGLEW